MTKLNRIVVLYGSQTYTAQEIAEKVWRMTKALQFRGPVQAMDDYPISGLINEDLVIFVCATTGQGDEPDNMKKFWKFLLRKNLPGNSLQKLKFGVIGLGDSSYAKFNFVAKKLHKRLIQLGASPLLDAGLCDYQHDLGHDGVLGPWLKDFFNKLKLYHPQINLDKLNNNFIPRWKVTLLKDDYSNQKDYYKNKLKDRDLSKDIYFNSGQGDSFCDVKSMEVVSNVRTTDESHFQDVRLLTLQTLPNDKLSYNPGDIYNIRPRNSNEDLEELFEMFQSLNLDIQPHYRLLVEECYEDMPVPEFLKTPLTIYEIAEQYWDLKCIPTQYVFSLLALVSEDKLEREKCIELSSPEGQEDWLNYCRRPRRTVIEVLKDFHKSTSKLNIDILFELFSTIKPRSFSIASSCRQTDGLNVDLLVAVVKFYSKLKKPREGLASNWLKELRVGDRVFGWIKKGSLVFPLEPTPVILIGPGTGLAPFLSLIRERVSLNTASAQSIHLFFGCRYREKDFHCKDELLAYEADGKLSLYCAFSRDQDCKIYVQHKIIENGEAIWRLVNEEKGWIYISGNSKNMPDNVKEAFVDVFVKVGGKSVDDAKVMLKDLENAGRLQTETW